MTIVENIANRIILDLRTNHNVDLVLAAYNTYCEDERDGRGYIFDIDNKEHVKWLFNNDCITTDDLLYIKGSKTNLFMVEDEEGIVLIDKKEINNIFFSSIENIVKCMLLYAPRSGNDSDYTKLYEEYVTDELEGTEFTDYLAF
jgi:hypothetical protein